MTTPSRRGRVLVADDDASYRLSTVALIRSWGFETEGVETGDQIQPYLQDGWADVVLADVRMPGNSDLECLEMLRTSKSDASLILMTGYPNVRTATRSLGLGAANYLVKPIEADLLRDSLDSALERAEAARQVSSVRRRLNELDQTLEKLTSNRLVSGSTDSAESAQVVVDVVFDGVIGLLLDLKSELQRDTDDDTDGTGNHRFPPSLDHLTGRPSMTDPDLQRLSPREKEVLQCLLSGKRVPTIAKELFIAENTVRNHLKSIFDKVGVRSQVELLEHFSKRD